MITVYGLLGEPTSQLVKASKAADYVVGGIRHLTELGIPEEKRIILGGISQAVEKIQTLPEETQIVVVASGDPLWFGVVRKLRQAGLRPKVVTCASSVAEAFARIGLPWDDAIVVSAHGRPIQKAIQAAKTYTKVAVMTDPRQPLTELTEPIKDLGRTFVLAERLGEKDERVRIFNAAELGAEKDVRQPNVVLVLEKHPDESWDETGVDTNQPKPVVGVKARIRNNTGETSRLTDLRIGQVAGSKAGQNRAKKIEKILGVKTTIYSNPATEALPEAFNECDLVIAHLALGATTRIIAPLLMSKKTDPGVVVIDQGGRFVVPLVGGHVGGANQLAKQLAAGLAATPVLTTATDSLNIPALDMLGWAHEGDVAQVTSAMLDGEPIQLIKDQPWPLPKFPENVSEQPLTDPVAQIVVTDQTTTQDHNPALKTKLPTVVLHPDSLVVGMGCNRGTSKEDLEKLLVDTLAQANLSIHSVKALTSVDVKQNEIGLIKLANQLKVPFITFPAATLSTQQVPNPSQTVSAEVGTSSVAEASVQAYGAKLVVEKTKTSQATCAIGRMPARGILKIVGLGPGDRDLLTPMGSKAIETATVIVGYSPYVRQIKDLASPGAELYASKMGTELERTSHAIQRAREGHAVALVCSGDPAIYAMASPTLELGTTGIDVEIIPGVTAELAASALLGAPLGHDHVTISLSDLHTSWTDIERRLQAAAEGDFVTVLYNPRSKSRTMHLPRALEILSAYRPENTPVAMVHEAYRPHQEIRWAPLKDFDPSWVNMNTIVIVGSSTTKTMPTGDNKTLIVTPRDYKWMGDNANQTPQITGEDSKENHENH